MSDVRCDIRTRIYFIVCSAASLACKMDVIKESFVVLLIKDSCAYFYGSKH